jgi:hypothetical protein
MSKLNDDKDLRKLIFGIKEKDFEAVALSVFKFQYQNNEPYRTYCNKIKIDAARVNTLTQIPFLPIQFFKNKVITSTLFKPQVIFESSGTTGSINSKHYIKGLDIYEESFNKCFELFYGNIKEYCILGLLPSYLERNNASLVYMVDHLIKQSNNIKSGFYLNDFQKLADTILINEINKQKTLLIGVTFALLDLIDAFQFNLQHTIVMETGGMKGRRKEISKDALHKILKEKFGIENIHSEYGMTELLSQSYSFGNNIFNSPPWKKIVLRSEDDPFEIKSISDKPITGAVNIIDLANIYSCSFIATDDMGKLYPEGSFEIMGRLENSDVRGCGLMSI